MRQTPSCPSRTPSLWPYLLICAVVAVVVCLGRFHRGHQGDTVLGVLISLQRWTPFFWEQDRMGMLVPLLSLPIRNPLLNLVAQETLNVFATLAAMFLLARYMLRDGTYPLAGTLSAAACLALAPVNWFFVFAASFFGVWLALGLGSLVLAEARPAASVPSPHWGGKVRVGVRWLVALGLMVLAHWVYSATAIVLGPMVVARFLLCGERRWPWRLDRLWIRRLLAAEISGHVLLLGLGFILGILFLRLATPPCPTDLRSLRPSLWLETCHELLTQGWTYLSPHHWPYFLFGTTVAGLLSLGTTRGRRPARVAWRSAIALSSAAAVYCVFMSTRRWVHLNMCDGRYTFPSFFLLQGGLAMIATGPLTAAHRGKGEMNQRNEPRLALRRSERFAVFPTLAGLILLLAALSSYHWPSLAKVRRDLDETLGKYTADILAARCTHLAGDYWKVWPAVFHANLALYDRGESRTIWGVSYRGGPTRVLWEHMPLQDIRVAVPVDDTESAKTWLQALNFPPLVVVEKRSTIYVLRPAAVVAREQQRTSVIRSQDANF